jgi:UDP-N-acetylglucosamine 2-epimerase (non-hydrolysing)
VSEGTNRIAGVKPDAVRAAVREALAETSGAARRPEKWDGRAAERIADIIAQKYGGEGSTASIESAAE